MGYCYHCGTELGGKFCVKCGAENPLASVAEPVGSVQTSAEQIKTDEVAAKRLSRAQQFELNVTLDDIPDGTPVSLRQATHTPSQQEPCPPWQGTPTSNPYPPYAQNPYPPQYFVYPPQMLQEHPVSVGGWIGRSLIPLIPVVGSLVYFIMLFIWMGDETKQETFRNWAKAQLLVMLIVFGIAVLLALIISLCVI